jgi:phospholipid/cholesterol/gamma-HCH transport system permease protein
MAVIKAAVFGFIIGLMGCYNGVRTAGGAAGVGKATTDAVVSAFMLILFSDLIITLVAIH